MNITKTIEDLLKKKISRRQFCKFCLGAGLGAVVSPILLDLFKKDAQALEDTGGAGYIPLKEAMYYTKKDEQTIQCQLCPRNCVLSDGQKGFCRARESRGGKHYSLVYGNPTSVHVDPIEKKPLFHFLPATNAFSIATAGCNFRCKYCQNWQISQFSPEETNNYYLPPEDVVRKAIEYNTPTVAYTYTEPSIFYEYMLDTSKMAKIRGLKNVYHSNGSLSAEPAQEIKNYLDGANIDLKGWTQDFYSEVAQGYLETVLNTLKILKKGGVWLEITNLVLPGLNDDLGKIKEMTLWINDNLGPDTPLHFSRFYPQYKLSNLPATPVSTIEKAREIAMKSGLKFVYIGNVSGHEAESTYCPSCKKPVIRRVGYTVLENNVNNQGIASCCGQNIPGVWS